MPRVLALLATAVLLSPVPAAAQPPNARGVVLNTIGQPIRGAIITATQPETSARRFTASTDARGEWVMVGLTVGEWQFLVDADGFAEQETAITVRVNMPAVTFVLEPLNLLPEGSLPPDILLRVDAANTLRASGDFEGAAAAFERLRGEVPELTMVNMVLGGIYRELAARAGNRAEEVSLLGEAAEAYGAVLERDASNRSARLELGATQAALGNLDAAAEAWRSLVETQPGTREAEEAAARLQALGTP